MDRVTLQKASHVRIAKQHFFLVTVSAAALALTACAVGPDFVRPEAPAISGYTAEPLPAETVSADILGGDAQRFLQDADVPADWWTRFGSTAINGLVEQALTGNPDLQSAQASLREASENYLAQRGTLFPSVDADLRGSNQGNALFNLYDASVGVSYVLDVFGGNRRLVESFGAQEEFQSHQLRATYLALVSNVLTAAITQASLQSQIQATLDIIDAQTQTLDLLNQQFELGAVARGDVLAQESQLAQTQATLPPLQKELSTVRHRLSILLGRFPAEGGVPAIELADLTLPQDLPLSLPSRLVEQRPDVRASESLLHRASADIGIATANMLPRITLTGGYGSTPDASAQLFEPGTWAWNLAGGITQPLFRGGSLFHDRKAAIAAYDAAAADYRSTVLSAFADVADVLRALELDAEALRAQLRAERSAADSLEITRERYRAGAISYLSLLDAERTYQQARIALVRAQANRFSDTVALFQALGGGWWNRADLAEERTVQAEQP